MKTITNELLKSFEADLIENEKSVLTVEKYLRDVRHFMAVAGTRDIEKQTVLDYKAGLANDYAVASANSMLASLNAFFRFAGWNELCVRQFKVQKQVFYAIEKDIAKLADLLGHSSINTIRIYIISTGIEHRQRMEKMRLVV